MKHTYTTLSGEKAEYTLKDNLTLSESVSFIYEVANMVVSRNLGYMPMLKWYVYDYCLIKYATDIDIFEGGKFDIDLLERFLLLDYEAGDNAVTAKAAKVCGILEEYCDMAIEYRKLHTGMIPPSYIMSDSYIAEKKGSKGVIKEIIQNYNQSCDKGDY